MVRFNFKCKACESLFTAGVEDPKNWESLQCPNCNKSGMDTIKKYFGRLEGQEDAFVGINAQYVRSMISKIDMTANMVDRMNMAKIEKNKKLARERSKKAGKKK